jgi:phospholipid/cholesterol/gamma-HCH transport system permease protein
MIIEPSFTTSQDTATLQLHLQGSWVISAALLEARAAELGTATRGARQVVIDVSGVGAMDTAGAWLIDRLRCELIATQRDVRIVGTRKEHDVLLAAAHYRNFEKAPSKGIHGPVDFLASIGQSIADFGRDLYKGIAYLGEVIVSVFALASHPARIRTTSVVYHIDTVAFRALPIIALINFLVGCIVAQQGIFQLQRFGAATFAVDLIGILVLRELAVLLTSIMVAGRSGSAMTAELGSMKMREEIDALRVMGLDPIEVLIVPRLLALLVALPLLTFVADMAALFGGMLVAWIYGGISPDVFLERLQNVIKLNTFLVGLIKAPFMALVIAMISAIEGMAVQGSAESLGRRVTASVVKSIFMVIVVDGLFAMFFAAVKY